MLDKRKSKVSTKSVDSKSKRSPRAHKKEPKQKAMSFKPIRYSSKKLNNYRDFLNYLLAGGDGDDDFLKEVEF